MKIGSADSRGQDRTVLFVHQRRLDVEEPSTLAFWRYPSVDEARLIEKLRRIEALYAGASTPGERVAAERAQARILARLRELEREDPPVEYQFSMPDVWSRRVFIALLRRYGLRPYRYKRQRRTTVMVRVSKRFVDETLWPEFEAINSTLRTYLDGVTDRVVSQVLHADSSDAPTVEAPPQLTTATTPAPTPTTPTTPNEPTPAPPSRRERKKRRKKRRRRNG